jgi:hypothetical protein
VLRQARQAVPHRSSDSHYDSPGQKGRQATGFGYFVLAYRSAASGFGDNANRCHRSAALDISLIVGKSAGVGNTRRAGASAGPFAARRGQLPTFASGQSGSAMPALRYPKAWGIGLPRTGTATLCEVFQRLGYGTVLHNPHFPLLETADAAADNECALFYRYLDYRFPGSKFILTTRPLKDWLKSIKYIMESYPVLRRDENIAIFRRMTLYGTVCFDDVKMIRAYIRHHGEVQDYFRMRPDDLLEVDFTRGDGWERICAFLDLPIPPEPFPHLNRAP